MSNKLKIAIFTDNFLPGVGGTENATLNIAQELKKQGHEVLVVAPHYKNENDANLTFPVLRKRSVKVDANDYYALPFCNKGFFKKVEAFNPDIIHCQTQASMLSLALKYAKKHNIPCISTIHTKFSFCYKNAIHANFIVKQMLKRIGKKLKKANMVTSVSYGMGEEFKLYGYNGEFKVIKNGATFTRFANEQIKDLALKQYSLSETENILLFVGRMTKVKNIQFIINSLEILNNKNIDFKMIFVGNGDDLDYFKKQCEQKGIKNKVNFTGSITDKKMLSSLYLNSTIYLFPSIFDNDSLTIIEASLYSLPTIAIQKTDSSERITDNRNGYLIQNDPSDMANKIEYIFNHKTENKIIGENASKEIPKTWEQATNEYLAIYNEQIEKMKKSLKK